MPSDVLEAVHNNTKRLHQTIAVRSAVAKIDSAWSVKVNILSDTCEFATGSVGWHGKQGQEYAYLVGDTHDRLHESTEDNDNWVALREKKVG